MKTYAKADRRKEMPRYDPTPPVVGMCGEWEACARCAGQGTSHIQEIKIGRIDCERHRTRLCEKQRWSDSVLS